MIEGLPEGQWAIIAKVHHCMVDGVSGTDLLLDPTRRAELPAPDNWVPAAEPSDAALITGSLRHLAVNPVDKARAFQTLVRALPRAATQLLDAAALLRSVRRQLKPRPPLSIEGAIGPHRRWAAARAELAGVKAIKQAFGGTINDVVLAVIAGAVRELLVGRGEDPDHAVVRTLVPVSIRSSGDHALHNQVSAIIAELPVGIADPVERLASMCQQMERLKAANLADTAGALPVLVGLAGPSMLALGLKMAAVAVRRFPQRAITTVTTRLFPSRSACVGPSN